MSDVRNQKPVWVLLGAIITGPIAAIIGGIFSIIILKESPNLASAIGALADAIMRRPPVIVSFGQPLAESTFTKESSAKVSAEQPPVENTFSREFLAKVSAEPSPTFDSVIEYLMLLPIKLSEEVFRNHLEIFEFFELDNKDDVYVRTEKLAQLLANSGLHKEAIPYYDWLSNQTVLSEGRRTLHQNNLEYEIGRWVSSPDFIHDIADNLVKAVITEDPDPAVIGKRVNVRQSPVIGDNIIESFDFDEEVQILERSDSRQQINGSTAYWYKISRLSDKKEGWVYGQFLSFYLHT